MGSDAWLTFASALAGVVVGGLISLATAVLTHRWQESDRRNTQNREERERRRAECREASIAYLDAAETYYQTVVHAWHRRTADPDSPADLVLTDDEFRHAAAQCQTAYTRLMITSQEEVREAAREYQTALVALADAVGTTDRAAYDGAREADKAGRERVRAAIRSELGVAD